jgi:hypothetical protein
MNSYIQENANKFTTLQYKVFTIKALEPRLVLTVCVSISGNTDYKYINKYVKIVLQSLGVMLLVLRFDVVFPVTWMLQI